MSTETTHIKKEKQLVPALRFKEFDGDWEKKKLGDILSITSAARVHKEEWTESGVPFFRSSDVVSAFKGTENAKAFIPFELYESLSKKIGRVKKDDLLVTGGGSIGVPYLIKNDDPLYFKDADLLWVKNTGEISGYFLYSFLITQLFRKYLKSISHIGTIAHYTVVQAKNTPCKFPSLPEQQKIASFLTAVDEKIQQLTRKKALLEDYKKGVMQQLFSGKLRFKDANGKDYPDWEEKRLNEFCTFFSGGTPTSSNKEYYSGNIPFIGSGNIYDAEVFSFISKEALDSSSAKLVGKGDLLYALYGANSGESAISNLEGAINQAILCIRTEDSIEYLNYILVSNKEKIVSKYLQGGQGNLSAQIIKKLKYKFPCYEEQQKIASYLSRIDTKIEVVNNQITQTHQFKKGLLQQLFV